MDVNFLIGADCFSLEKFFEQIMSDQPIKIKTEDGKLFDIPAEGSLGLLALGAIAVKPWREARKRAEAIKKAKQEAEKIKANKTEENNG